MIGTHGELQGRLLGQSEHAGGSVAVAGRNGTLFCMVCGLAPTSGRWSACGRGAQGAVVSDCAGYGCCRVRGCGAWRVRLVWGAVEIAHGFGVSDLIIGLTIVAVGTSLPELASSVAAARKGEDDLALGNVIGSNLFNTLGVVGLAAAIQPMSVETQLLSRDIPVMCVLTLALFVLGYNFGKSRPGRINRLEGCLLLAGYIGYTVWLIESTFIRGAA